MKLQSIDLRAEIDHDLIQVPDGSLVVGVADLELVEPRFFFVRHSVWPRHALVTLSVRGAAVSSPMREGRAVTPNASWFIREQFSGMVRSPS